MSQEVHFTWKVHLLDYAALLLRRASQLLLHVYRTTKHTTTGQSPHKIDLGFNPFPLCLPKTEVTTNQEPADYSYSRIKRACLGKTLWR